MNLAVPSFIISIVAILISLFNWLFAQWQRRTSVSIEVDKNGRALSVFDGKWKGGNHAERATGLTAPCFIVNKAESDIAITQIMFFSESGATFRAAITPEFALHRFKRLEDTNGMYEQIDETAEFPINLGPKQASYQSLRLLFPADTKLVAAKIITNRKNVDVPELAVAIQSVIDNKGNIKQYGDS